MQDKHSVIKSKSRGRNSNHRKPAESLVTRITIRYTLNKQKRARQKARSNKHGTNGHTQNSKTGNCVDDTLRRYHRAASLSANEHQSQKRKWTSVATKISIPARAQSEELARVF